MAAPSNEYDDALEAFCRKFQLRKVSKNRPMLYQGEIPPAALCIKSGVVKMYNITPSGEEKIVGYESRHGLIPLEWVFSRSRVSSYYYDAFTDCQVYSVDKQALIEVINQNPTISLALLDRFVSMYIGANIHLHAVEQNRARNKLLYIFQYLVLRFGEHLNENLYRINLRLTHQDIANLIGSTRETTSTEIGKLTKEGIVSIKDLRYVVDTDLALRQLGEADFAHIKL